MSLVRACLPSCPEATTRREQAFREIAGTAGLLSLRSRRRKSSRNWRAAEVYAAARVKALADQSSARGGDAQASRREM